MSGLAQFNFVNLKGGQARAGGFYSEVLYSRTAFKGLADLPTFKWMVDFSPRESIKNYMDYFHSFHLNDDD